MDVLVMPRVRRVGSNARLALVDVVRDVMSTERGGLIVVAGGGGSGKTMAMKVVERELGGDGRVKVFDDMKLVAAHGWVRERKDAWAVMAVPMTEAKWGETVRLELCEWEMEDCLEYLAQRERGRCAALMERMRTEGVLAATRGVPQLLVEVMEGWLGGDLGSWPGRLAGKVWEMVSAQERDLLVKTLCYESLNDHPSQQAVKKVISWWRHEVVKRAFLGKWVGGQLRAGTVPDVMARTWGEEEVAGVVDEVRGDERVLRLLKRFARWRRKDLRVGGVVSVLVRLEEGWRPAKGRGLDLRGAKLRGVKWAGVDLRGAKLDWADLRDADLSGANLKEVTAVNARMEKVNLKGACLVEAELRRAKLGGADLSEVVGRDMDLQSADLTGARLWKAELVHADLEEAILARAEFRGAVLTGAFLRKVQLEETDFVAAKLNGAEMDELDLSKGVWDGASFVKAKMAEVRFEYGEMRNVDFSWAYLRGALLTGSRMRDAKFTGACLRCAGLAEIVWEGADLRQADLWHVSFHMGSSRSGLVGSVIASEGTRTGFYTDDYRDQDHKPPEEIRKACLAEADLREAEVEGTDFYLVDVRRAVCSEEQWVWLRKCGAIWR